MNLLTIPLAMLRKAVQLHEERDALLRELAALDNGQQAPKRKNQGAARYWAQWRKQHRKESNAETKSN